MTGLYCCPDTGSICRNVIKGPPIPPSENLFKNNCIGPILRE